MSRLPIHPPFPATSQPKFRTRSTNFAAALIAASLLDFQVAELASNARDVVFVFDDPQNQGEELLQRFDGGALPRVEAKALFSARGFLSETAARVKKQGVVNATR